MIYDKRVRRIDRHTILHILAQNEFSNKHTSLIHFFFETPNLIVKILFTSD